MLLELDSKNTLRWALRYKSEKLYLRFFSLLVEYEKISQDDVIYQCYRGAQHCELVESTLNHLIPNITKRGMSATECFCLLSAVWFHDISPIFKKKSHPKDHHYEYLYKSYEDWSLDEPFAYAIKQVCCGTVAEFPKIEDEYQIGEETIRLKFLACLLRLSDWLDLGYWGIPHEMLAPWKTTEEDVAATLLKDKFTYEILVDSVYWIIDVSLTPNPELLGTVLAEKIYEKIKMRIDKEFSLVKDVFKAHYLGYQGITVEMKVADRLKRPLILPGIKKTEKETNLILPSTPYKFLDYYDVNDTYIYFGRKKDVSRFLGHIASNKFLVIYGESGVGKTSLIKAGLIPRIDSKFIPIYVRCDDNPCAAVKNAVISQCKLSIDNPEATLLDIFKHIETKKCMLFIDQFEEFFKRAERKAKDQFINELMECVYSSAVDARFVISIRRDFFVEMGSYREELPELLSSAWELSKLTEVEARHSIIDPAKLFNIDYDLELLDELVKDITEESSLIHPTHIQILCNRLMETLDKSALRDRLPQRISYQTYKELGGAQGIISDYLDTSLDKFPAGKKEYARDILRMMTTSYEVKTLVAAEDILVNLRIDPVILKEILSALVEHRLLRCIHQKSYELTSDYLAKSITEKWLTDKDVEIKTSLENIHAALEDWKQHRWLMNIPRFGKIYLYREDIIIEQEAFELLLKSSLKFSFPAWYWAINIPRERVVSILLEITQQVNAEGLQTIVEIMDKDSSRIVGQLMYRLEDLNPLIREKAAELLGRIKDTKATDALLSRLNDPDWRVARVIGIALGKIGDPKAFKAFLIRLDDPDWRIRKAAASALGMLKDPEAIEPLLARINDPDNEVRRAVAIALGDLGDLRAFKPLQRRLNDSDSDVREAAVIALGNLGNIESFESIVSKSNDPDWRVREAVAIALSKVGGARSFDPLFEMLSDADSDVRKAVAKALGMLGIKKAIEPLLDKLNDSDWWVREAAANALSGFGDPRTLAPLLAGLNDPDWRVREAAANAMGNMGGQDAFDALLQGLNDLDWRVRKVSIDALGKLGNFKAVDPLFTKLSDSDSTVRASAVYALGNLGDPNAIEHLIHGLDDPVEDVQIACLTALRAIDKKLYKRSSDKWGK
ncbi:HEAT repeat domain-containing protein [Candidatus Desantisbacteria bacterium]|nr:HEAT repeat domain-containing protein [Candidatus Desantisbacteria bacterium]